MLLRSGYRVAYMGGDYMPLGNAATIAAVVGTNYAVRHQFEFDCFFSIHTKKWFPSHAEDVIVGIVAL